ncbi:hypothetical protein SPRG_08102 [Saprolegnia parasitica CBS 223.65]|uniref:Uncharacterized protein n=1 Tax=Saprolegnia parasitica (strain CBS 223.65) TaxID=695850 RepID=A0A067CJ27_SAPPC|nr:hypothetical protein SPRG_08102 [Saprolegnia parasitica CBS 223.65]KDO26812.1 hypothetical protein SPRG_08102 [Saprolegnia parasitica CBS 223.65]|eukprot:XP_012202460.1 hypothetical protein SPRG_08102 [Saprolegnia parasitica CBS 223.65]
MQVPRGPRASLLPERVVTFNKVSIVFSSFFLLNLASMPLKVYLTESLPWMSHVEPSIDVVPSANETFAAFKERALAVYTTRYTSFAHTNSFNYFYDAAEGVNVLHGPLQRTTEAAFTYEALPGAFFYSNRARQWVRDMSLGNRTTSSTALVQLGTRFGSPSTMAAIWTDAHDNVFFAVQIFRGFKAWGYINPQLAAHSFVRINQIADLWAFAVSTLYLSRTVWFGYLVLNLSGRVLRRCALESWCAQADPTGVAIGVALTVGPLTYLQLRSSFFIDLYHVLYTCFLPHDKQLDYTEDVPPAILYTIVLGALPLVYTFSVPALKRMLRQFVCRLWFRRIHSMAKSSRRRLSRVVSRSSLSLRAIDGGACARLSYNDWKHRLLLGLIFGCCCCRRKHRLPKMFRGGSIYKLFMTHRHLQCNAAFSFRGSDCYVLSHTPNTVISYRLSLSDAMYLEHRTDIVLSTSSSKAFGRLVMQPKGAIEVQVGADRSRWIM